MPRVCLARQLNHRAEQIENADRANARQSVTGLRATRSWTQTDLPISERPRAALHLRTAERLEHRVRQFSCALQRHPHSFPACGSREAPNRRDGRQIVAKTLRRRWRPGPCTQLPPTASCDLPVRSIRHRHTELEVFAAWQLLRSFAGQAHEELALASFFRSSASMFPARSVPNSQSTAEQSLRSGKNVRV